MNALELIKQTKGEQTHQAFADRLGVSQSLITMVLTGKRKPTWSLLQQLAAAYPETRETVQNLFFATESHNRKS